MIPFRVYAAIATRALAETRTDDLGDLAEQFKTLCARQDVPYDAETTQKAIDAARVARAKRRA